MGFFLTWLPYALVSGYSSFINNKSIDPLFTTLPAVFAKSSMLWVPAYYFFSNKNLTKSLCGFEWKKNYSLVNATNPTNTHNAFQKSKAGDVSRCMVSKQEQLYYVLKSLPQSKIDVQHDSK